MPRPALDTHAEVRTLKQAGCPEEQAEAIVDLVSRAPLNAQVAGSLEQVQFRLESIESNMATQPDLKVLGAETIAAIKDLRSEMFRMIWLQGAALATLILGLAGIMLTLALA